MKVTRCIYCGRPVATDADWKCDDWGEDGSNHLCWGTEDCGGQVDDAYRRLLKYVLMLVACQEQPSLKMLFAMLDTSDRRALLDGDTIETIEEIA